MKNQLSTVTEVVVRSTFYIITNFVFVSMGLSFHTHWIAIFKEKSFPFENITQ